MNSIDIVFGAVVVLFGVLGLYWGFIRQVLSLVGLLVGVVLASRYGAGVADALLPFLRSDTLANTLGFIVVLILVNGIVSLLATALRRFAGLLFLGWLDHLFGGLLGLIQAALLCTVLAAVAVTFPNTLWIDALRTSHVAAVLLRLFGAVLLLLPEPYRFAVTMMFDLP